MTCRFLRKCFFLSLVLQASACGGGGGGGSDNNSTPPSNRAPVFTSAAASSIAENEIDAYLAVATDSDAGDTVNYALTGGADSAAFSIDAATGSVRFVNSPDYENPADSNSDNIYEIRVAASDGRNTTNLDVAISVTDVSQLVVDVHFPRQGANLGGDITTSSLSGILTDLEDGEVRSGDVAVMTANGVDAVVGSPDESSWFVDIPVVDGTNQLNVIVESRSGDQDSVALSVDNSLQFFHPTDVAVDAENQRIIILDGGRLLVGDLVSGMLQHGAQTYAALTACFSVDYDSVNSRALSLQENFRLDQTSLRGGWLPSFDINNPRPGSETHLTGLQVASSGASAYLLERRARPESQLLSLDIGSGDLTVLSSETVGTGVAPNAYAALGVDEVGGRALVADPGVENLVSIDLATGDRTVVSGNDPAFPMIPAGYDFNLTCSDLAFYAQDQLAAYTNSLLGYVMGIEMPGGARFEMSGPSRGVGPPFEMPLGMGIDGDTGDLYVADAGTNSVFRVDKDTGDRTAIFDTGLGNGPNLYRAEDIRLDISNQRLLVSGGTFERATLYAVDITTGDRVALSGENVGSGPVLARIYDFDTNLRRNRVLALARVVDPGATPLVVAIDLSTGERSIVSSDSAGTGFPVSIAVDPANDRAFVADVSLDAILEVDLVTGDRVVVADGATGSGELFMAPTDVVYDPTGNRLFISAVKAVDGVGAIMAIDLSSGSRTVVSEDEPMGHAPGGLYSLQVSSDGSQLLAYGTTVRGADTKRAIFSVDTVTGDRAQRSFFAPDPPYTPNFERATGVAYDEARSQVFVTTSAGRIRQVDLRSGRSAIISD